MSTGSSAPIPISRVFPFGGGPWSEASGGMPPSPPPIPSAPSPPASTGATNGARPLPLRPIPIPLPPEAAREKSRETVAPQEDVALDDLTFGKMFADVLRRREFLVSVVSCAVHMVLIIVLALFYVAEPQKNVISLESSVDKEPVVPDFQPTPPVNMEVRAQGPLIRGVAEPTAPKLAAPNLGRNPLAATTLPSLNALRIAETTSTGGANGLDAVSFFNSTVVAKRIAFVVDASTSMGDGKFDRAKEELLTAVSNLNPRQRFYVYFFSDKEYPMLPPRSPTDMLALDTKNWESVLRWVNEQGMVGDTRPKSALRKALALKPDVVYLLTDGEFTDDAYDYLMDYTNYKVRINTIGFRTNPAAREVLEKIARKFRGEFTAVD